MEEPWYGTGQGSGNSPGYWLLISSALLDCFEEKANGAKFCSPDGSNSIKLFMTGFVDDKNARTNMFEATSQPTDAEMIELAQKDAQLWRDLLASSGRKLEPLKCCYYMTKTIFASSGAPTLQ